MVLGHDTQTNQEELPEMLAALERPTQSDLPTLRALAQGLVVHEPRQVLPLEEIMSENGSR